MIGLIIVVVSHVYLLVKKPEITMWHSIANLVAALLMMIGWVMQTKGSENFEDTPADEDYMNPYDGIY